MTKRQIILSINDAEENWIRENLEQAENYVGKKYEDIDLADIDEAYKCWFEQHDPEKEDPNPFINMFGLAFGYYVVNDVELEWAVVKDKYGTDIALHGEPGEVLIFPTNFVSKRYETGQTDFFSMVYKEMRNDILRMKAQDYKALTQPKKPWWKFW